MIRNGKDGARSADLMLEPPIVRSPEIAPAAEDRTYLGFIAFALAIAIGAGFLLAIIVPLASAGIISGADRLPWLIQAHGWAQLQGWTGLFVAGMAIRLIPRFAGRQPIRGRVTLPILVGMVSSAVLRTIIEPWGSGTWADGLLIAAGVLGGLGMAGVTGVLAITLSRSLRHNDPWKVFAWAGSFWWAVWAVYTVVAAARAADNNRLTPFALDDAMTWMVLLGVAGNLIWAVQSRSVPVFFGRKPPPTRRILPGLVGLNAGIVLVMASLAEWDGTAGARIEGAGLLIGGLATAGLAPICGSVWGTAHRLRPRARPASWFVLAANHAAVLAGLLLLYAGARTLAEGEMTAFGARDAARHAVGLGVITMLILGMAQLVAPVFALRRGEPRPPSLADRLPFWLLLGAVVLRVASGLLQGQVDSEPLQHTMALAGLMAWLALVLFAATVIGAVRDEPRMKAKLAGAVPR